MNKERVVGRAAVALMLGLMMLLFLPLCGCGRDPAAQPRRGDFAADTTSIAAGSPSQRWQAGVHYEVLTAPQASKDGDRNVEVLEFFYFGCPHCYALEASLATWIQNKPTYIEFRRVPATWMPAARAHARLFYTLQALGREDLHQQVFVTLHEEHGSLYNKDEQEMLRLQVAFARAHGIAADAFTKAYQSPQVEANMRHADDLSRRYRVVAVPAIVVNSTYKTSLSQAGGRANDLLALVNELAALERLP